MKKIYVGLIKGRHDMPVDEFIFDQVVNPCDFNAIKRVANDFVVSRCNVTKSYQVAINQADSTEVECFTSDVELNVYVTGLTACTAAIIQVCALNGVNLVLHHFNSASGEYVKQVIF